MRSANDTASRLLQKKLCDSYARVSSGTRKLHGLLLTIQESRRSPPPFKIVAGTPAATAALVKTYVAVKVPAVNSSLEE